jgi:nitrite reductase/ring-hydroxylating ferredoxin subunit
MSLRLNSVISRVFVKTNVQFRVCASGPPTLFPKLDGKVNITNLVRYCYCLLILRNCITLLMSNQIERQEFIDASDIKDVPPGKMKHVEVEEKEILLANPDGKVYALCNRCSHMNAPLSMGALNGKVVTCPMHGARYDVTTGKKIAEPMALDTSKFPEPVPESLQKMFARSAEIQSKIKTYDQPIYETKVEGNRVKVRM